MRYSIAKHIVEVDFWAGNESLDTLLPSFVSFKSQDDVTQPLLKLTVLPELEVMPKEEMHLIRDVDTGNGMTRVEKRSNGDYQFTINNVYGECCALLQVSSSFAEAHCVLYGKRAMHSFALNNCLMLSYAFAGAQQDTLLVHASVVRHAGKAYAFTAKSGTGKSTQVANWMCYIEGCDIVNDDNPIFRIVDGKPVLYGSPWSGKTPCYRNIEVPLGALIMIKRDEKNFILPQQPIIAFSTLLAACSAMKWDEQLYEKVCDIVTKFIETIKVAELHCLPNAESALVCQKYISPVE